MYLEVIAGFVFGGMVYIIINYVMQLMALRKYPPGPVPLPIIGNLHQISRKPHESFKNLSKTYGDVFSLSMGSERVVIVNNIEIAREALIQRGPDVAGRPMNLYTANLVTRDGKDIAFSDYGDMWKTFRKIAHQSLKMYGDGMGKLELLVVKEIRYLAERLDQTKGLKIDPFHDLSNAVMNIICAIVFGSRYDVTDFEFREVVRYNTLLVQGFSNSDAVGFLPWLRFFPSDGLKKLQQAISIRDPILGRKLQEHKETYNENNLRDFTDAVLNAARQEEVESSKSAKWFTDDHLTMILNDVFSAGAETTVTTLRWALVYLVNWPEVQQRAKEELKMVLGRKEIPDLSQRKEFPYLEAVIHETLRKSSLIPLGVPHKTIKDTKLNGHSVPSNTQVLFNIWALHYDERHWAEPDKFNPDRWLDKNGHFQVGKNISYLPFSAGRRVCLGETLAKAEIFLFLSYLLHNYDILPADPNDLPSTEGVLRVTFSPNPYDLVFKRVIHA